MNDALAQVARLVADETGIVIRDAQLPALAAAVARLGPGLDAERFLLEVNEGASSGLVARLVDEVTVQETYFFREPRELRGVEWERLAEGARRSGSAKVRIWVSACSTGEEAYTVAILAGEALGSGAPPVDVLGTDVSLRALEAAREARYSSRSLRAVPTELRRRYFADEHGRDAVREGLRSLVRFRLHNLAHDPAPPPGEPPFDVIVCRNVLIYFDGVTASRVIDSLEAALVPGGSLILGAADRLPATIERLDRVASREGFAGPEPASRPKPVRARPRRLSEATLGAGPARAPEAQIADALRAADSGDLEQAISTAAAVLSEDPLNADAYFVRGLAELGRGDSAAAVGSLRRALYVDPSFGLAAFKLGRAHDTAGDEAAARRAYAQALRTLDPGDRRHRVVLKQVDVEDVAAACRVRLGSDRVRGSA